MVGLLHLTDRQGVEELVGDQDGRAIRNVLQPVVPLDGVAQDRLQRLALAVAQVRAGFHQMDDGVVAEQRQHRRRPQHVGHQRAAAGTQLHQMEGAGAAQPRPCIDAPEPDQFAEHLADFRRGGEIAALAERIAPHVIAEARIAQRLRHEGADADRPVHHDAAGQQACQTVRSGALIPRHGVRPAERGAGRARPATTRWPASAATAAVPSSRRRTGSPTAGRVRGRTPR